MLYIDTSYLLFAGKIADNGTCYQYVLSGQNDNVNTCLHYMEFCANINFIKLNKVTVFEAGGSSPPAVKPASHFGTIRLVSGADSIVWMRRDSI